MHKSKLKYKQAIKDKERANQHQLSDALNDALLQKDGKTFWRSWQSKVNQKDTSKVIDGLTNSVEIVNRFASLFKSACVPDLNRIGANNFLCPAHSMKALNKTENNFNHTSYPNSSSSIVNIRMSSSSARIASVSISSYG